MLFTRSQTSSERWTAALRVAFTLLVIVSFAEGVFAAVLLLIPGLGLLFLPLLFWSMGTFVLALPNLLMLRYAQTDPPPSSGLPFLSFNPRRNLAITLMALRWGFYGSKLAFPLLRQWCTRRVVLLSSKRSKFIVSENIAYQGKYRLSVYHPRRSLESPLSAIIVLVPSPTSVFPAAALSLIALRLRVAGYTVILPTNVPVYPNTDLPSSVRLIRHVLAWTRDNAASLDADVDAIYLLGHGCGALLAMMAGGLRDAVVQSRDEFLWSAWRKQRGSAASGSTGFDEDEERDGEGGIWPVGSLDALDGKGIEGVSNGLRRVEVWGEDIEIPQVKGIIALSPLTDAPQQIRHEASISIEHLSSTRRFLGPSQTDCMLASPSHLLFTAKGVLNVESSSMIRRWLIVHGGEDDYIPATQSILMRELLAGLGVPHVHLQAYKELGHVDTLLALMIGLKHAYGDTLLRDIDNLVTLPH